MRENKENGSTDSEVEEGKEEEIEEGDGEGEKIIPQTIKITKSFYIHFKVWAESVRFGFSEKC